MCLCGVVTAFAPFTNQQTGVGVRCVVSLGGLVLWISCVVFSFFYFCFATA